VTKRAAPRTNSARTPPIISLDEAEIMSGLDVARLTGLSLTEINRAARHKQFPPSRRTGRGRWSFARSDVMAWIASGARVNLKGFKHD
jgi:predicted DNA-binding transcriptional regulator AlpA